MDALTTGTRDLPDRARLQPARRRPARRLRSAAVFVLIGLAACGDKPGPTKESKESKESKQTKQSEKPTQPEQASPPEEDFHSRFLEREWTKLGEDFDAKGLIKGLRKYIDSEGPIYPLRDRRFLALHNYLYFAVPDPTLLKPLLGARKDASEIEDWVLRRDHIAMAIITSYYRRLVNNKYFCGSRGSPVRS